MFHFDTFINHKVKKLKFSGSGSMGPALMGPLLLVLNLAFGSVRPILGLAVL